MTPKKSNNTRNVQNRYRRLFNNTFFLLIVLWIWLPWRKQEWFLFITYTMIKVVNEGLIHTYRMVILQNNNNNNNNEAKMSLLANRRQLCWIAIKAYNLRYLWNGRCVIEERRTNKHHHRDIEWRPKCTTHIIHNNFDRNCFALSRMPPYLIIYVRISTHNFVTHCNYVNKLKHESTCK